MERSAARLEGTSRHISEAASARKKTTLLRRIASPSKANEQHILKLVRPLGTRAWDCESAVGDRCLTASVARIERSKIRDQRLPLDRSRILLRSMQATRSPLANWRDAMLSSRVPLPRQPGP